MRTSGGGFVTEWGRRYGDGEFGQPGVVAVDQDCQVHVVDAGNDRIQKFAPGSGLSTIALEHDAAGVVFERWTTGYSAAIEPREARSCTEGEP